MTQGKMMLQSKKERLKKGNLFIPLLFSLGAKVEDFPIDFFLNDPTKISNSLRVIHNYFKVDGVVCCGEDTVLWEDLGGADFTEKRPLFEFASKETFACVESRIERIALEGKSGITLEVAKRLNTLMPDTIVVGMMAGPIKLACQLSGASSKEVLEHQDLLTLTTKATLTFIRALGETGIDLLFIRENKLPLIDSKSLRMLTRCYSPLLNTTKYYGFKALLMPDELAPKNVVQLKKVVDEFIFPAFTDLATLKEMERQSFSLPIWLLEKPSEDIESYLFQSGIADALKSSRLFMVTTDQEIPETINNEFMIRGVQTIRDFLNQKF